MGVLWNIDTLNENIYKRNNFPIFTCVPLETIKNKTNNYKYISLNKELSSKLINYEKEQRVSIIEIELEKVLFKTRSNKIIITDIDILFNPEYRLDIIKTFIQLSKNKSLIIQWPGEYNDDTLIYSEPQYSDYKKYSIKYYDIICLIGGRTNEIFGTD